MAISEKKIWESVLDGIAEAHRLHTKTSRRRFVRAPEHWVTNMVARQLAEDMPGCGVELEPSVKGVMDLAKAVRQGKIPRWLRETGRFDIVVWPKGKKAPYGVVEIKHRVQKGTIPAVVRDVQRIAIAIDKSSEAGAMKCGCVGFYCVASPAASKRSPRDAIQECLKLLEQKALAVPRVKKGGRLSVKVEGGRRLLKESADGKLSYGSPCAVTIQAK